MALGHAKEEIRLLGRGGGNLGHAPQLSRCASLFGLIADFQAHPRQPGQGIGQPLSGLLDAVIERGRTRDIAQIMLGRLPGP